jgi:acetyl-CoA carboxylase biotin carboxyl carrier protein
MDFDDIERILELVREHDLAEFELERDGLKLRVRKAGAGDRQPAVHHLPAAPIPMLPAATPLPMPAAPGAAPPLTAAPAGAPGSLATDLEADLELAVVKSPIVGTFYRSPEPGAPSFVEIGDRVRKDQVLCIIEAMKLMNEITSEFEGEVVSVYAENGKPVQYGERLFAIRTT